ncbi:NUDIX hydrolase [Pseudaestuariivita sp.]|uniref:NUDIX hydrolase n=1 Tax=Pseudaestuariivita sp. TaxID=2211669 RepID=UPI00405836FE
MTPLPQGLSQGLGHFTPRTDRDAEVWDRITRFVASEPRAFTRDATIGGHVTASAFLLSPDRSAVLLTHHRKLGLWLQLGGHCDGHTSTAETALREAQEEGGQSSLTLLQHTVFDIDIHQIPATAREPAHLHYDVRWLFGAATWDTHVSDESHALAWVPLGRLEEKTTEPSILRMRDLL